MSGNGVGLLVRETTETRVPVAVPSGLSNWKNLYARIRGVSPLLMHNPAGMKRSEGTLGMKVIPTPLQEALDGLYRLPDGRLFIKADAVRESMKGGGIGHRLGKKAAPGVLAAAVIEHPDHPFFIVEREDGTPVTEDPNDWTIDTRRAVVVRQGILRSRAAINPWYADIVFQYDSKFVTAEHVITFIGNGGQSRGLLDYRPQKGGPFGRFEVISASSSE